jgi:hypothetical protein
MRAALLVLAAAGSAAAQPALSVKGHITVKHATIQAALDAAVPATIDQLTTWNMAGAVGYRFGLWRDPIQVQAGAGVVVASAHVEYALAGCVGPGGHCKQVASCGLSPPRATIDVQVAAKGRWQPDWTLRPDVALHTQIGTPCKLTRVNINASAIVLAALQPALQAAMATVGRKIDVRGYADKLWAKVPATQLGPDLWLAWNVAHVVVGPIQYDADAIGSDVELDVVPRLVEGATAPANGALPEALDTAPAPGSHTLGVELVAAWPDLEAMFASVVGTIAVGDTQIRLLHVRGNDAGIEVEVEGSSSRVTAELVYDEASDDLHARNVRVGEGKTLVDRTIAHALEPKLHVQLRPLVARHLDAIDRLLAASHVDHPSLASGVQQHVSITSTGVRVELAVAGALGIPAPQP